MNDNSKSKFRTLALAFVLALMGGTLLAACDNQGPAEEAGENIDDTIEDAQDSWDDTRDEIEEELDDD
ncbi:hypothetical protein [Marinimicrobium alkaliphilum]|uniref:hypothetical protein n=1 Tax=Marinimicrobium alkaliphilum TaxID=2202654 RepID=UPI000DBA37B6|nr:hypothetical protein [Marinimicrobium alkaliphilum]